MCGRCLEPSISNRRTDRAVLYALRAYRAVRCGRVSITIRLLPVASIGKDRGVAEDPSAWRCGRSPQALSGVPYKAPMRESSPGGSYGTASRGRPLRPEAFPYEVRLSARVVRCAIRLSFAAGVVCSTSQQRERRCLATWSVVWVHDSLSSVVALSSAVRLAGSDTIGQCPPRMRWMVQVGWLRSAATCGGRSSSSFVMLAM
jgi:hypothetical protein